MNYIAFVCGHNSGRSQMAQAIFNTLKKISPTVDHDYEAISWGTGIGGRINPRIVEPLKAIGIDVTDASLYFPKDVAHPSLGEKLTHVRKVYTMGCMDKVCDLPPRIPLKVGEIGDWDLDDPAKDTTDVIAVRDRIIGNVLKLVTELEKQN
jgi:protein-tyrosine-phosphatase